MLANFTQSRRSRRSDPSSTFLMKISCRSLPLFDSPYAASVPASLMRERRERDRTVDVHGVRIDQDTPRPLGTFLDVEHRLILKTGVVGEEVVRARAAPAHWYAESRTASSAV